MSHQVTERDVFDELWEVKELLLKNLRNTGSDENEVDAQDEKYVSLINDKILSVFWHIDGENAWEHIDDLEDKNVKYRISDSADVNAIAETYFSQNLLRGRLTDWLFVNALMVSAYQKIALDCLKETLPRVASLAESSTSTARKFFNMGRWTLGFLLKWAIIILVFSVLLISSSENSLFGILAVAFAVFLVYRFFSKRKAMKATAEKYLIKMRTVKRAYSLVSTPNIQWSVLLDELNDARKSGVEWPSALFSAALSQPTKQVQ